MSSILPVLDPMSPHAAAIRDLFWQVLWMSAGIFLVVSTLIVIAVYRGRRRARLPEQDFGNETVEIAWTLGPILIVVWLILVSAKLVLAIGAVPAAHPPGDADAEIVVTGHRWWWQVDYLDAGVRAANELYIPVGRRIRLRLDSADVVHSFWVPRLGRKMDMLPGRSNHMWLQADEPGVYQGRCAEFCGTQHAWMAFEVRALEETEYERWLENRAATPTDVPVDGAAAAGRRVFLNRTCTECHAVAGQGASAAPDLTHVASRDEIGAGVLANTPENLRRWLADPQSIKPGCKMPDFRLSDDELDQLVAYLETLR